VSTLCRNVMNLEQYRRDLAQFHHQLTIFRWHAFAHETNDERGVADILATHENLYASDTIANLAQATADTSVGETEREARRRLSAIARRLFIQARTYEVNGELQACENTLSVKLPDMKVTSRAALSMLAGEEDSARRQDLASRWFDAVGACDDLRVACWRAGNEAKRELEANEFQVAEINQSVETDVTEAARIFLQRTAETYHAQLSRLLTRAGITRTPTFADSLFFSRLHDLKNIVPLNHIKAVYHSAMGNFGINVEQQANLHSTSERNAAHGRYSLCFAFAPPADVRLVVGSQTRNGRAFVEFCGDAGQAQSFASVSSDLAARHPELTLPVARLVPQKNFDLLSERVADFAVVHQGYAYLFQSLCTDAAWLRETCSMSNRDAEHIRGRVAFAAWHDARRLAALVLMQSNIRDGRDPAHDDTRREYAATLTEATGFLYTEANCLIDVLDTTDAAREFRARLFAVTLREHLRTRHGRTWWKQKSTRDELIDMWNTGARYEAEELAALIGAGTLDVETLIGNHLSEAANTGGEA